MTVVVFDFGASEVRAWDLETQTPLLCEAACLGVRQGSFVYGNECKKDLDSARDGTRGTLLSWRRKGLSTLLSPPLDLCRTYQEALLVFCDWLREQVIRKTRMTRAVVLITYAGQEPTDDTHANIFRTGLQCPVVVQDHTTVMAAALKGHAAGFCSIGQSHCVVSFGGQSVPIFAGWDEIDVMLRRHVFGHYAEDGTSSVSLDLQLVKAREALCMEGVNEVPLKSISDGLPRSVLSRQTMEGLLTEKIRAMSRAVKQSRGQARANFIVTGRGRGAWWLLQVFQTKFTILRHVDTERLMLTYLNDEMAREVQASPRPITPAEIVRKVKGSQQDSVELSQLIDSLESKLIHAVDKFGNDAAVAGLQRRFDQMNMRLDGVTAAEWSDLQQQVAACLARDPHQVALRDQLAPLQRRVVELEAELAAHETAARDAAVRAHEDNEALGSRDQASRRELAQTKEVLRQTEAENARLREIDAHRVTQMKEERVRIANDQAATAAAAKSQAATHHREARASEETLRADNALLAETSRKQAALIVSLTAERDHERASTAAARQELVKATQERRTAESECERLERELAHREKCITEQAAALEILQTANADLKEQLESIRSAPSSGSSSTILTPQPTATRARARTTAEVLPQWQNHASTVRKVVKSSPSIAAVTTKRPPTSQTASRQQPVNEVSKSSAERKGRGGPLKESSVDRLARARTPAASRKQGWDSSTR